MLSVKDRPKFAMSLEGYYSMKTHVMVRFGRWQEIIEEPLPDDPELYLVSTAMHHYAKGIAHATLKQLSIEADEERRRFHQSLRPHSADRRFFNNDAHDILGGGREDAGRRAGISQGQLRSGFCSICGKAFAGTTILNTSSRGPGCTRRRHALAALLSEQGHYAEAEQIYRDDLGLSGKIQRCAQHPDNVWALHGLVECLQRRGESRSSCRRCRKKLAGALEMADVPITSSCMCREQKASHADS